MPPRRFETKRLKALVSANESQVNEDERDVSRAELVLGHQTNAGSMVPTNDMDKTWRVKQRDMLSHPDVDLNSASKALDLRLGDEYSLRWTHNGRYLALGGRRNGHLAVVDTLRIRPRCEIRLGREEIIRDVTFFHDETIVAAAQKKHVFVYSTKTGVEIHKLKAHIEPTRLEFLRYHFLLASSSRAGFLHYQDVSTGALVGEIKMKMGTCSVLAQNPRDAVLATGHQNGVVARWAPSQGDALVKMLCHRAPVTAVAFEPSQGHLMATAGLDGRVTLWDARKFGKLFSYHTPGESSSATALAISQRGLLAWTTGREVRIWPTVSSENKAQEPYMMHRMLEGETASCLQWRPYEDILAIGHSNGVQTILVPGAGDANFDAFESNPFARLKQRREAEVHALLDKIPADTIGMEFIAQAQASLQPSSSDSATGSVIVGGIASNLAKQAKEDKEFDLLKKLHPEKAARVARERDAARALDQQEKQKNRGKGRGKIGSRLRAKRNNIITVEREKARNRVANSKQEDAKSAAREAAGAALRRFMP